MPVPVPPLCPPHRAGAQRRLAQRCVSNTACSRSHSWKARLCVLVTPARGDSGSAGARRGASVTPAVPVSPPRAVSPAALTVLAVQLQHQAAGTGLEQDEAFPHRLLQRGQRAEDAQEGLWGWTRGLSPARVPLEQRGAPVGTRAGRCTFMWTLHRKSSVSGPALPGSYSWKKRGAKRKEAKAEREELTARRDSWGDTATALAPHGGGTGAPPAPVRPRHAAYPALGGLQVELVADAGQGVHGSAEDWEREGAGVRRGPPGRAAPAGPPGPSHLSRCRRR